MELGGVVVIRFSKPRYPDKQTINLAVQETDKVKVRNQLISFGLFLICLVVFAKFAVIDRLNAAEEAKRAYLETQQQIQMMGERTKEYSKVQELYSKLNNSFLSESEAVEIDRMEIMSIVEECVLDKANMESINITKNQVMISIVDTTLESVSEIVAALEANEKTAYVTVSTAGTEKSGEENKAISADIMVQLKTGGDNNE